MTKYTALLLLIASTLALACDAPRPSAEARDQAAVARQQNAYAIAQPIPRFDFSLERDITIQLYRARNEHVATWTVWRSQMGHIEGDCPSIGFPLPYDTSLTNPLQVVYEKVATGVWGEGVIEQPEPNGIYASKNSVATWVRCVLDGQEVPVYVESTVTAYPYPVLVDYDKQRVTRNTAEAPSVVLTKGN